MKEKWSFDVQHESQMENSMCSCSLSDPLNNALNYMLFLFQHNGEIKRCFASYTCYDLGMTQVMPTTTTDSALSKSAGWDSSLTA